MHRPLLDAHLGRITPVEEIVQTLGDLVRVGKIRHYAFSDIPAWFAMKAAAIASERCVPGPIALQVEYSLVALDIEAEHISAAREGGMGVMPWSPLAGGFLTGKYKQDDAADTGRLSGASPFGDSKFSGRNWEILVILKEVAAEQGRTPTQIALAWVMAQRGVAATLVGARSVSQLSGNLAATDVTLTSGQMNRLDQVSAPAGGFSASLAAPMIRRMVLVVTMSRDGPHNASS